jgi:hypothetical protein
MQSPDPLSDEQRKENRKARPQSRARIKAMTQKRKRNRGPVFVHEGAQFYFWNAGPSLFLPPDNETTSMVSDSGQ